MRMTSGFAAALLGSIALTAWVPPAEAKVDTCARACRVVFSRGGGNCQKKVKAGIRARQKQCKTDAKQTGFASVQKCRTAANVWGQAIIKGVCRGSRIQVCNTCCSNGGTKDTCAPKSPSGAFIDLDGPML